MKKAKIATVMLAAFLLAACQADEGTQTEGNSSENNASETTTQAVASEFNPATTLIAYFSMPESGGVDAVAGSSRVVVDGEVIGNTQQIANWISQDTGVDTFRIETEREYSGDHDELIDQATEEGDEDARPALSTEIENFDQYDVVFVGFPIWNARLPMPMMSFFDDYDFSGKTIVPFSTHGGSSFGRTISQVEELEPDATVVEGLTISRNTVSDSHVEVTNWLANLSL
ncbi:flavodoxin [Enterococcus sp. HY326]|uniref:flavodoxin n=1 Tax=Enterococcus sp. HY326 TaxID=2971265 RepID=UPI00223F2161|nr:flavodoxin [Enterococcus sp. HY326]